MDKALILNELTEDDYFARLMPEIEKVAGVKLRMKAIMFPLKTE